MSWCGCRFGRAVQEAIHRWIAPEAAWHPVRSLMRSGTRRERATPARSSRFMAQMAGQLRISTEARGVGAGDQSGMQRPGSHAAFAEVEGLGSVGERLAGWPKSRKQRTAVPAR